MKPTALIALGKRRVIDVPKLHARQDDAIRRKLYAADRARRQGFGVDVPFLALGKRHEADRAFLFAVVAHYGRVHGTEPFDVTGRHGRRIGGTRETVPVGDQRVPLRNDEADQGQNGDESQSRQLDQDDEVEPPPGLSPAGQPRRCAQTSFVNGRRRWIVAGKRVLMGIVLRDGAPRFACFRSRRRGRVNGQPYMNQPFQALTRRYSTAARPRAPTSGRT